MNNILKLKVFIFMLMLIVCGTVSSFADSADYLDHWAQNDIEFLMDKNIISGYEDGLFKPNNEITRAEFIKVINNVFGFSEKEDISFSDVKKTDWFYKDVEIAVCAGYISGYEDNTLRPNNLITRQEAAKIISAVYDLSESNSALNFKDSGQVDAWAKGYVAAVNSNGVMNGYNDNTFRPEHNITRAETAKLICNASGDIFNSTGEFSKIEKSNAIINKQDITLKNVTIDGNLYLTEGIGNGDVTLDNVTIKGKLIVRGGGNNSIHIINSSINELYINRKNDFVRVVLENVSASNIVAFDNSIIAVTKKASVKNITINGEAKLIVEKSANVDTVKINSKNVEIILEGTIGKIDTSEDVNINGETFKKGIIDSSEINNKDEIDSEITPDEPNKPEEPDNPETPETNYSFDAKLDKEKYDVNEIITLTEKVCKDNIGLGNVDITFKLYGDNLISIDQFTTNSNGEYEYKFKVPAETDTGSYKILLCANGPVNKVVELNVDIDGTLLINKDKLNEKIIEAEKLIKDEYTEETWALLQNSLKTAKNILAQEKLTQIQIDEALKDLEYSISRLIKKATVYRSELQDKIAEIALLIKDDYTVESWDKLQLVLSDAQAVLSNDNSTYVELKDALDNLSDAVNSLEKIEKIDKTLLQEEIDKVEALVEAEYTEDSWNELQKVLISANNILSNENTTQKEVDEILENLRIAVGLLVKKGEESNVKVEFVEVKTSNSIQETYAPINGTTGDLLLITTGLLDEDITSVVIKADNEKLLEVTQRPEYPEGGYPKSKTRVYGTGRSIGETKMVAIVTSKDGKLFKSECKVTVLKKVDSNSLREKWMEARKLVEKDYTTETWSNFKIALDKAELTYKDTHATQEEVDKALADLTESMNKLQKISSVDKNALQSKITEAKKLIKDNYTEETWQIFINSLNKAEAISTNADATQEEVDEALSDLESAISSLEKINISVEDIGLTYYQNGNKVGFMIGSDSVDSTNYFRVLIGDKVSTTDFYTWYGMVDIDISMDEFETLLKASDEKIKIEILDDAAGTNVIEQKTVVLKLHGDKSELNTKIDEAKALVKEEYTEETWKSFESALKEANRVKQNSNATQAEVDKALSDLNSAISNLEKINVSAEDIGLTYYQNGNKIGFMIGSDSVNSSNYFRVLIGDKVSTADMYASYGMVDIDISMDEFETLLKASDEKVKIEILDDAAGTNVIEQKTVVLKLHGDKSELNTKIDEAKALVKEEYTEETWKSFESTLKEANRVKQNLNATQEEVDKALSDLESAIKGLSKIQVQVNIKLSYYDGSWDGSGTPVMFEIDASDYNTTATKYKIIIDSRESTVDLIASGNGSELSIDIDSFKALLAEKGKVTLVLLLDDNTTEVERLEIVPVLVE